MVISIITPCYNAAPYIATTIKSVQQQTFTGWEMIVVDDGSTDDSAEIVRQISQQDSRIKLVQKENGGSASARKIGLSLAKGEYIQFLDADDLWRSDKLKKQIELIKKENAVFVYTSRKNIFDDESEKVLDVVEANDIDYKNNKVIIA